MIIVSGLSGSGKSIALETLEDLGYYCVDNLPLGLLIPFAQTLGTNRRVSEQGAAVGIDARNFSDQIDQFPEVLSGLRSLGLDVEIVFLQADESILLKRFSETRRRHPLTRSGIPLVEAIGRERALLEDITAAATLVVDTSTKTIHELRDLIRDRLHETPSGSISLQFESFGFKNGVPVDADFVFDVRCLPNPHWRPALRNLTGRDTAVIDFLHGDPLVEQYFADMASFLRTWLPRFETGSRSYLTVAIGCTGGQHRSVYLVERLARTFGSGSGSGSGSLQISSRHRELGC